jgi:hypothetical protein
MYGLHYFWDSTFLRASYVTGYNSLRVGRQHMASASTSRRRGAKGLGLVSIGEGVDAIGGSLDIQSEHRVGTQLKVTVPRSVFDSMTASSSRAAEAVVASLQAGGNCGAKVDRE